MINYFTILRLNFLRDNQMSYEQSENCSKNPTTWVNCFRKQMQIEKRASIRDSRALGSANI